MVAHIKALNKREAIHYFTTIDLSKQSSWWYINTAKTAVLGDFKPSPSLN